MMNPPTNLERLYPAGNEDTLPYATGGEWGETPDERDELLGSNKETVICRPMYFALAAAGAAGDKADVDIGDRPEYWTVCGLTDPNTGTEVWVWADRAAYGPPIAIISGTGHSKFPGVSQFLHMESRGANAIRVLARAVRGYDFAENTY